MPTDTDSKSAGRSRLAQVVAAVVVSMVAFGVVAVVLAELWPPTFSQRRMVFYLVTMMAVAVGVVVANVWAAARAPQPGWNAIIMGETPEALSGQLAKFRRWWSSEEEADGADEGEGDELSCEG